MPSIQQVLLEAISLQKQGQLSQAATLYEAVLQASPNQPDALHLLGLVKSGLGQHTQAVDLIQKAVQFFPENDIFLSNLGVVLKTADRVEEAILAYREALRINPKNADALFNIGKSLKLIGELAEAESCFQRAVELEPQKSAPWLSLMNLHSEAYDLDKALAIAREAVERFPNNIEILLNVGAVHKRCQDLEAAVTYYKRIVELDTKHIEALCRVASTYFTLQKVELGKPYLERALLIAPDHEQVFACLGLMHNVLGNATAAVEAFSAATTANPKNVNAHASLAVAFRKLGSFSQALKCVQRALEVDANNVEALAVYGGVLLCLGQTETAETAFRTAIKCRNGAYRDAHHNLLMCMQYRQEVNAREILQEHQRWNATYAKFKPADSEWCREKRISDRPLKLGFVSGDLGAHPVGYFLARMFENIDSNRLSCHVYSDRMGRDWLGDKLRQSVTSWTDTFEMSDTELLKRIRSDSIDILFDLAGHTAQNRLLVFAQRAAPIQITWAGYVGTTGIANIDYILADRFHVPQGFEEFFSEKVLRMPNGYVTYLPPENAPNVSELPALTRPFITFGSMCNPAKVNSDLLRLWSRILTQVPKSKLLLCYTGWPDPANQQRVQQILVESQCANRVNFDQKSGAVACMEMYNQIDIALDTRPYSGGLTTCEALWMGVPTITWPEERFASRHSFSHLSNVGLTDWIVGDADSYVDLAVRKSKDLKGLAELRAELRSRVANSPLCNGKQFADDFGKLIRQVWRVHCTDQESTHGGCI